MNKCENCDGDGAVVGEYGFTYDCLDCDGTGDGDFDPFHHLTRYNV